MRRRLGFGFALASTLVCALACASPEDMAKSQMGSGECADKAEEVCDKMSGADQQACLKRQIYMCEELKKSQE
jgi:hypothetical protein